MRTVWTRLWKIPAVGIAAVLAVGCVDEEPVGVAPDLATQVAPSFSLSATPTTATDLHLVLLRGGIPADFGERVSALGGTLVRAHPEIGVAVTRGLSDAAASRLARDPSVSGIERDVEVQWVPRPEEFAVQGLEGPGAETDQSGAIFFAFWQWNLRQIDAHAAWPTTNQGQGIRVAILDTGIDPGHFDLDGKVDIGSSASVITSSPCGPADTADILDRNFHGSFVAGLVSSLGRAMASVAPDATLIGVKVLTCVGSGTFSGVIAGIVHAVNERADVINMSLGAYFPIQNRGTALLVAALDRATNFANRSGVVVVVSAGNAAADLDRDRNFIHVPSQSANVLSVGATGPFQQDNFDQLAFYTNFGVSGVDVMAPGGNFRPGFGGLIQDGILSVCSRFSVFFPICGTGNFYLIGGNGTSFSAPHAAGTAAVVKSESPGADAAQIRHCIFKGADDLGRKGTDKEYSRGRINVAGAAEC